MEIGVKFGKGNQGTLTKGDHVRDLDPFKRRRRRRPPGSAQEGGEAAVSVRASLEDVCEQVHPYSWANPLGMTDFDTVAFQVERGLSFCKHWQVDSVEVALFLAMCHDMLLKVVTGRLRNKYGAGATAAAAAAGSIPARI